MSLGHTAPRLLSRDVSAQKECDHMEASKEYLLGPLDFSGTLSLGERSTPLDFQVSLSKTGDLDIVIPGLPVTKETRFILSTWPEKVCSTLFTLTGASADGRTITSDGMYLTSFNHSDVFKAAAKCTYAIITAKLKQPQTEHVVCYHLRAFQGFYELQQDTEFGRLHMTGQKDIEDFNQITGALTLVSSGTSFINEDKKTAITVLLDHVLMIMSFAAGTYIRAPIRETYANDSVETHVWRLSEGEQPFIAPMSHLNLDRIFGAAVSTYESFKNYKGLKAAIEWLLMPTTYNELTFVKGMVALEHLVAENKPPITNPFTEKQRADLRNHVSAWLLINGLPEDQASQIVGKLTNIGAPTLAAKITAMLDEWKVPTGYLPPKAIKTVVDVRNKIVHSGIYYGKNQKTDVKLWTHITVLYEMLTRIVLTLLNYSGPYYCHIDGYHVRMFPSCKPT